MNRILLVEDDPFICRSLTEFLKTEGFDIVFPQTFPSRQIVVQIISGNFAYDLRIWHIIGGPIGAFFLKNFHIAAIIGLEQHIAAKIVDEVAKAMAELA